MLQPTQTYKMIFKKTKKTPIPFSSTGSTKYFSYLSPLVWQVPVAFFSSSPSSELLCISDGWRWENITYVKTAKQITLTVVHALNFLEQYKIPQTPKSTGIYVKQQLHSSIWCDNEICQSVAVLFRLACGQQQEDTTHGVSSFLSSAVFHIITNAMKSPSAPDTCSLDKIKEKNWGSPTLQFWYTFQHILVFLLEDV